MYKLLAILLLFTSTLTLSQSNKRDSLLQVCKKEGDFAYLEHGRTIIGLCSSPSDTSIINTVLGGVWRLVESCDVSQDSCNRLKSEAERVAIYLAGFTKRVLKDPYKAEAVIEASTERLMEINDSSAIAGNYISLGIFKRNRAEYEGALKAYRQALEMFELIGDYNGAANCYHNISNVFSSMNNLDDAFTYQHKAMQIRTEHDLKSSLPYSFSAMCNLHNKSDNPDSCEYYLNKLLNYDGEINKALIALAYSNTGIAWANADDYEKAKPYYFKSLEIREQIGNRSDIANSKINIGYMLMNTGDASKTERYCLDGYQIAEEEDLLFMKMNACGCLYKYYEEFGQASDALKFYKLYNTYSDSLRSEEDRLNLSREQLKYNYEKTKLKDSIEFAKKEELTRAENARLQALSDKNKSDLERKRAEQMILYGGLVIILLFAVFIVNRLMISRKQKLKLHEQNEELESQRAILAEKNKEITDSIHYAKRIQLAVLPPKARINTALPNSFVLYKPKDIVAGDFYWMEVVKESGNSTPSNSPEGGEPELPVDPDDSSFGYITTQSKNYKHLKQFAKDMRKNPTEAERAAWELLRNKKTGFNIRRQHIIDEYIVDFVCLDKRLVIEIDGGIHDETKEQDFIRDTALNNLGFDVMRFTNDEVLQSPEEFTNKITSALVDRQSVSSKPGSPPLEELEEVGLEQSKTILFAAADCTGHGVPGAMVSVVCNNGLNRSVREHGLTDPGQILDKTREIVIAEFEKSEDASGNDSSYDTIKDGMDIALCSLSFAQKQNQSGSGKQKEEQSESGSSVESELEEKDRSVSDYSALLKYAGANNPLWIIRRTVSSETESSFGLDKVKAEFSTEAKLEQHGDYLFIEIKADKQPIGKYDNPLPYTSHTIQLEKGDRIYLFSDGFADQFGGQKGKKLKAKNLKALILSIQSESMSTQKSSLDKAFENWKGNFEQLDDVCIFGVEV